MKKLLFSFFAIASFSASPISATSNLDANSAVIYEARDACSVYADVVAYWYEEQGGNY